MNVIGKSCSGCGVWKPLALFGVNSSRPDGCRSECKACALERERRRRADPAYRALNKARVQAWRATPEGREANRAASAAAYWTIDGGEAKRSYMRRRRAVISLAERFAFEG